MRKSASEIINDLEMRIARLEKQSTKEKTLFERVSNSDKKKVHKVLRDEMIENYTSDRDPVESDDGETFSASFHLKYKVPLRPICKVLSRFFRQEVTREDLQPFLDDFYPEEMNLNGSTEDIERSGFYDIWDLGDYYSDELIYSLESSRLTRISTEIEIEDVDGEYLIANAYIRIYKNF